MTRRLPLAPTWAAPLPCQGMACLRLAMVSGAASQARAILARIRGA